jgi:hypothetical protein
MSRRTELIVPVLCASVFLACSPEPEGGQNEVLRQPVVYTKVWPGNTAGMTTPACKSGSGTPYVLDHFWSTVDGLGCHDPVARTFTLETTGWTGSDFYSEPAGAPFIVGDFNHDGESDIMMRRSGGDNGSLVIAYESGNVFSDTTTDYFPTANRQTIPMPFPCPVTSARLITGDFNGDGRTDLLCHHTGTGTVSIAYANGTTGSLANPMVVNGVGSFPCAADADLGILRGFSSANALVCHSAIGGVNVAWPFTDSTARFPVIDASIGGFCAKPAGQFGVGDFNGDGVDDIVCHDHQTGYTKIIAGQISETPFRNESDWVWEGAAGNFCPDSVGKLLVTSIDNTNYGVPAFRRASLVCVEKTATGTNTNRWSQWPMPVARVNVSSMTSNSLTLSYVDQSPDEVSFVALDVSTGRVLGTRSASSLAPGIPITQTITNLTPSTRYCIQVKSRNFFGDSTPSGSTCVTTSAPPPPAAPSNLTVAPSGQTSLTVAFDDNSSDESGFNVYVDGSTTPQVWPAAGGGRVTRSLTGLSPARRYCVTVRAANANGVSMPAGPSCASTLSPPPPQPPTLTSVRGIAPSLLAISFTDNSNDESGFYVYLEGQSMPVAMWGALNGVGGTSGQSLMNLTPSTEYCVTMRAFNGNGISAPSTRLCGTTWAPPPPMVMPTLNVSLTEDVGAGTEPPPNIKCGDKMKLPRTFHLDGPNGVVIPMTIEPYMGLTCMSTRLGEPCNSVWQCKWAAATPVFTGSHTVIVPESPACGSINVTTIQLNKLDLRPNTFCN